MYNIFYNYGGIKIPTNIYILHTNKIKDNSKFKYEYFCDHVLCCDIHIFLCNVIFKSYLIHSNIYQYIYNTNLAAKIATSGIKFNKSYEN